MGFRGKIVLLLAVVSVLMLGQIIITLSLTGSMNRHIKTESNKLVNGLTTLIEGSAAENAVAAVNTDIKEFSKLIDNSKNILNISRLFFTTQRRFAALGSKETELAVKETGNFCSGVLKDSPETIFGLGATYEVGQFSKDYRYFVPYAFRENGEVNYSDNVEIEGKDATEPLTEMEMDGYMENEFGFEYYTRAIPLTHDRNAPAPEGVFWTEPYLDYTANIVLISAASPLNDDGKALGVVFVDLSLETLGDILSGIANRYDNPVALTFSYGSHNIFGALGLDDFKPREEADPENLGEKTVKLFKLDDVPLAGPKVVSMMDGMKPGDIKVDEIVYNNKTYTIIVANQSDLFGLMLLIPHEEIFADTIKARELMTSLYETQERDLARVRAATLMSLILILAIMTVVIIFVRNATKKLVELAWSLDREAQEISQISDNTSEVAAALDDQSAEQLRSLSKTSDAMKEISEQISFSVQSSKECSEAMKESALEVEKGEKIASTVRKTMDAISNTTNEISRILTSMQGIAFQTNLLALNASVEAARAGELGQGFAVVAGEVRTLSMRSNEAAQKTESLMEGAITGSRDGEKYAQALTEGFERIGTAASNASGHVKTINQASQEQKHAVDRVADNLDELNETVERNNNLAQKSLDNSHALSGKAESLNASALELKKLLLGKHPARMDSDSYIDHASQFNVKASSLRLTDK